MALAVHLQGSASIFGNLAGLVPVIGLKRNIEPLCFG